MNGKKAKAFVVAFLLCGVFGGLVAQPCLGDVGDSGWFGSTTGGSSVTGVTDYWFASPFSVSVDINVTEMHLYVTGYNYYVKFFIYSLDGTVCYYGSATTLCAGSSAIWVNLTGVNTVLEVGTYLLGVRTSGAASIQKSAGNGCNGTVSYTGAWGSLSATNTNNMLAIYANYTETDVEGGELELSMGISSWGGLAVSVFLVAVCLVLALKSKSWAVNFLFGLGTVGFLGWVFANATVEVYGGWLTFMVLVGAVLVLVKGAVLVRASGV